MLLVAAAAVKDAANARPLDRASSSEVEAEEEEEEEEEEKEEALVSPLLLENNRSTAEPASMIFSGLISQ